MFSELPYSKSGEDNRKIACTIALLYSTSERIPVLDLCRALGSSKMRPFTLGSANTASLHRVTSILLSVVAYSCHLGIQRSLTDCSSRSSTDNLKNRGSIFNDEFSLFLAS
ncbi:hypothetical protein KC19_2G239200 [Ceratodon purpureus]|uniref:Uncharacterized protein n=1 Tax=Ceratodon purpureus TaxID=3225 RepID=A0A8T0IXC0_CERPU|nr:hypothetical protein KC19_2G239200 [Ceratodon purpureus]